MIFGRDRMFSKKGILAIITLAIPLALCPFSSAFANPAVVTGASGFIEAAAAEAGLSAGDFIATVGLSGTIASGVSLSGNAGLKLGQSMEDSLTNLIEAADYPDYSTLSAEKQESWGSKENYDAAKFNSLMNAFGLGDARDGWYSSGGGNFEWENDWADRLHTLGRIGQNWINGAGNTLGSILDTVEDKEVINNYIGYSETLEIDGSNEPNWPSGIPTNLIVNYGANYQLRWSVDVYVSSNRSVYYLAFRNTNNNNIIIYIIDKYPFTYGYGYGSQPSKLNSSPQLIGQENYELYRAANSFILQGSTTFAYNDINHDLGNYTLDNSEVFKKILYGTELPLEADTIQGYPEDVTTQNQQSVPVYYPVGGFNPSKTWNDYITNPNPDEPGTDDPGTDEPGTVDLSEIISLLQQFQFYATGQLKVHDEGVFDSLTDITTLLQTIISKMGLSNDSGTQVQQFDWGPFQTKSELLGEELENLAPFGAIFLVSNLVETVAEIAVISEPQIEIPFNFFEGHEQVITIDLAWIDDGRAVINVFVILSLMLSLAAVSIRFIEIEVG